VADAPANIKAAIRDEALRLGFDAVGFAPPALAPEARANLAEFLRQGLHGDMGWLANRAAERADPQGLWPEVRSIIVLGLNYAPCTDPLALLAERDRGGISVYARNRDYHDLIKSRLKALARWIEGRWPGALKVFVDTAPVMEKPLAQAGGIGWQGKHTNLVSRGFGSWLFLGEIYLALDLAADPGEIDHCGACRRCLDACPTGAFPAPYRIDARRCISYLTIEHKGHIPAELRPLMGNRIYGCDDCLAVCPWNKFARATAEPGLAPRAALTAPRLAELARLDDARFRALFASSPVKRIVLIAIGNSGARALVPAVEPLLADPSPLVRAMAVWALTRLETPGRIVALCTEHLPGEYDPAVRGEWERGLALAHALRGL
jgi:epoxyqueuosine reductase